MTSADQDEWVSWHGGPHILLPVQVLHLWEGIIPPSDGRVVRAASRCSGEEIATDYDLACDMSDLIGTIVVGDSSGLVVGDEVPMSTLTHAPDGALVIFVPMTWEREDSFRPAYLRDIVCAASDRFQDSGVRFQHPGGNVALQPAAFEGIAPPSECPRRTQPLAPRTHEVWTIDTSSDRGEFRAHWLRAK